MRSGRPPAPGGIVGACLTALWLAGAAPAAASDFVWELSATGWFFGAEGDVEDTDLDALDFDDLQGQPQFDAGVVWNERHHVEVSYLLVRRSESGIATGFVLGILPVEDRVSIDLDVDYLRGHYGYSLIAGEWIDLQPFLEVGYLREDSVVRNETVSAEARQDESGVFPLPGAEAVIGRTKPIRLRAKMAGIGTGERHLIDFEGAVEGHYGPAFGGLGYRYVDVRFDTDGNEVDISLGGLFVQGGVRF